MGWVGCRAEGGLVWGVNTAGVCAALAGGGGSDLTAVLEAATSAAEAARLAGGLDAGLRLLVADPESVAAPGVRDGAAWGHASADGGAAHHRPTVGAAGRTPGDLDAVGALDALAALTARAAPDEPIRGGLAARLVAGTVPEVWAALGPPRVAVPIRVWPGLALGLPAGAGLEALAGLGTLAGAAAAAVAAGIAAGTVDPDRVDTILAAATGAVRAEGGEAERQARLMDAAGDDTGCAVRRVVAVGHAAAVVEAALRSLLGVAAAAGVEAAGRAGTAARASL